MNIKVRQGICYSKEMDRITGKDNKVYRLVILVDEYYIGVIPVDCLYNQFGVREYYCYDEPQAQLTDGCEHNILLKDSPKPFTDVNNAMPINGQVIHNVFVKADVELVERIPINDLKKRGVESVDDGYEISDDEWDEICKHMDITQLQKEFTTKSLKLHSRDLPDVPSIENYNEKDKQPGG